MSYDVEKEIILDALLLDDLTGIRNRRSYDEDEKLPVQVGIDHVLLYDINKEFGNDIGDWILCKSAEIFTYHTDKVYRLFSDKFIFQLNTNEEAKNILQAILTDLSKVNETLIKKTGEKIIIRGIAVYQGIAETSNDAFNVFGPHKKEIREREFNKALITKSV
ncbi:MAG: diguanylate cyclase [Methylococcales bacterium]